MLAFPAAPRRLLSLLPLAGALAVALSVTPAEARNDGRVPLQAARPDFAYDVPVSPGSRARSDLGGGFVEFLVTGRTAPVRSYNDYGLPRPASQRPWRQQGRAGWGQPWQPGMAPVYPPGFGVPRDTYRSAAYPTVPTPAAPTHAAPQADGGHHRRMVVEYTSGMAPGSVVIDTGERYLYLVMENGKALRYGVGVGREGFSWSGTERVTRKREWPDWRPPAEMLARRPDLPRHMPGGPDNPLGARALYLGDTLYRIHGSNEPETIGHAVSSGCIRMRNEDVIDLYERVPIGATVKVI